MDEGESLRENAPSSTRQ